MKVIIYERINLSRNYGLLMNQSFPAFHFNHDLQEAPDSLEEFQKFVKAVEIKLDKALPELRYNLLTQLGVAYRILKKLNEAEELLREALKLAELSNNQDRIFSAKIRLAHCFQWQKRFELSDVLFQELQNELFDKHVLLQSFFWQHKGKNEFDQEHYSEAFACFEKALEIRVKNELPQDLIESSRIAISETKNRINNKN